jgi:glucosamine--fructose-6-phosphate aminotransferase (isomerizing)
MPVLVSPLLDPSSTMLDERGRAVVQRVTDAERAHILALPSNDPLDAKLRQRVLATGPELFGQTGAVQATLAANHLPLMEIAHRLGAGFDRLVLVGCGDSLAVMIAARAAFEAMLGIPCEPVQSMEFAYYQAALVGSRTAVIVLSSSGETTRTVEALLVAQHRGAYTVGVTNTPASTLATEADVALKVEATRVGWPTQSSTAALALLLELAILAGEKRVPEVAAPLRAAFDIMPGRMAEVLADLDPVIAGIAAAEVGLGVGTVLFAGAGPNLASAVIGAAKVKECTVLHAQEIQVEEYHHYNSQKAGEPLFLLVPSGPSVPRAVDTGRDAHRWGGRLYVITSEGEAALDELRPDGLLRMPRAPEALSALLYVLPAQLVGYHLGLASHAAAQQGVVDVGASGA